MGRSKRTVWSATALLLFFAGCTRDFDLPPDPSTGNPPSFSGWIASPSHAADGAELSLTFVSSKALAEQDLEGQPNPQVSFGEEAMGCSSADALTFVCTLTVGPELTEGSTPFVVVALDREGLSSGAVTAPDEVVVDRTAPGLIASASPIPVSRGAPIVFNVMALNEMLAVHPIISSAELEGAPTCVGVLPGTNFECAGTVSATARLGSIPFDTVGRDLAGNETTYRGALSIVDTPPTLVELTVTPSPARAGDEVQLTVTWDVPVSICHASAGGQVALCDPTPPGGSTQVGCTYSVPGNSADGLLQVVLSCENSAAQVTAHGALQVDTTQPVLDSDLFRILRNPGALPDQIIGSPGATHDDAGLIYADERVVDLRVIDGAGNTLMNGLPRSDGSFTFDLPTDGSACAGALAVVATDLPGNETVSLPGSYSRRFDFSGPTCTPTGLVSPTLRSLVDPDPTAVAPAHALFDGNPWPDSSPLAASDGTEVVEIATAETSTAGAWIPRSLLSSPSPRTGHAMAYDIARGRTVLFGGGDNEGIALWDDTWEWDGATWSQPTLTGDTPFARVAHAMAYDALRGVTVMFGGTGSNTQPLGDTWEYDGASWRNILPPAGAPPQPIPQANLGLVWATHLEKVVLLDRAAGAGDQHLWAFDGDSWVPLPSTNPVDQPGDAAMVYDPSRHKILIHGGRVPMFTALPATLSTDGVIPDLLLPAPGDPARFGHSIIYDAHNRQLILFGGASASALLHDQTFSWSGLKWIETTGFGVIPSPRWGHAMAFDTLRHRGVLFGGNQSGPGSSTPAATDDTWEFELSKPSRRRASHLFLVDGLPPFPPGTEVVLDLSYVGAGLGDSGDGGNADPGVVLQAWNWETGGWDPLGQHSALLTDSAAARTLTFAFEELAGTSPRPYLASEAYLQRQQLVLQAVSLHPSSDDSSLTSELHSDYLTVTFSQPGS